MFDQSWQSSTLGELADISSGESLPSFLRSGPYQLMGANGRIGRASRHNFNGGLLVGRVGAAGEVTRILEPCWVSDNALMVRPRHNRLSALFAYHLLESIGLNALATKTAQPLMTQSQLNGLKLFLPKSLHEQTLIACVLDTLDAQIEKTRALIAKLEKIKEGLLHDLLTRGIDGNGQLRPSPEQAPELYKDSPLGQIPREWETRTIAEQTSGISYGFTNPMPSISEGPWMLTATDIKNGKVSYTNARHTSYSAYTKLSPKSRPKIGEILITKDGTLGRVAIVDKEEVCINQSVASFMPNDAQMREFILLYLTSPLGQEAMLADAGGSTIKHLYISKLSQMRLPDPGPNEANEIAKKAGSLCDKVTAEKRSFQELTNLKAGLMDDLLTGRVRVKSLLEKQNEANSA